MKNLTKRERSKKYVEVIQSMTDKPSIQRLSDLFGIHTNQVVLELKQFGLEEMWHQKCQEYGRNKIDNVALTRENKYFEYFEQKGFIPFCHIIARELGLSLTVVKNDFKRLGLKPMSEKGYKEKYDISLEKRIEGRENYYLKNYFYADEPLNHFMMARYFQTSCASVKEDLEFLSYKYELDV